MLLNLITILTLKKENNKMNIKILTMLGLFMIGCTDAKNLQLYGNIYVKGSAPHTYIVIEDSSTHKNYQIINAKDFNLQDKQKQHLKLKAKVIKESSSSFVPTQIEVLEVE